MSAKIQIIFYSMYGRIYKLSEAIAAGISEIKEITVEIFRVPELFPEEILIKSGAKEAQKSFATIPIFNIEQMDADAYIFTSPLHFGNICAPMRIFFEHLGNSSLVSQLVGKIGSIFTDIPEKNGEKVLIDFHTTLMQLGMIIIGNQTLHRDINKEPNTLLTSSSNKSAPSDFELAIAKSHGKRIAEITRDLKKGRSAQ